MNFLKRHKNDIAALLTLAIFIWFIFAIKDDFGVLSDREKFQQFIEGFGLIGPLAIILIIIIEVVIAPIPGFVPIASAGFIFGPIEGSIYTYIGNVIGSILVFLIARKYGRMFAEKVVSKKTLDKYEGIMHRKKNYLFAFYFFPVLPSDMVSIAFGLSDVRFKTFITYMSLGFITNVVILNYLGDYLARLYF